MEQQLDAIRENKRLTEMLAEHRREIACCEREREQWETAKRKLWELLADLNIEADTASARDRMYGYRDCAGRLAAILKTAVDAD